MKVSDDKSSEVLTLCFNFYSNEKKTVLFSFSLSAIEEDSNIRNSEAWVRGERAFLQKITLFVLSCYDEILTQ